MNAPELLTINGKKYVCKRFNRSQLASARNFLNLFGVDFLGAFDNNIEAFAFDVISRNVVSFNMMEHFFSKHITIPMVRSWGVVGLHRGEPRMPVLVMECAVGTTIKEWINQDNIRALTTSQFSSFIEKLVWIQIADFIIGQKDRHNDNVMISFDSGSGNLRLTDIDNDVCLNEFGPINSYIDGELVVFDRTPVVFPPLITPTIQQFIANLNESDVAEIMNSGGRDITKRPFNLEYKLMVDRIKQLKYHYSRATPLTNENILKIDLGKNPRTFPTWQNPYVWYAYSRYDSYVKRYLMISGGNRAIGYKEAEAMVSPLADMVNLWAALCANHHESAWAQSINNATVGGLLDYISQTRKAGKIP